MEGSAPGCWLVWRKYSTVRSCRNSPPNEEACGPLSLKLRAPAAGAPLAGLWWSIQKLVGLLLTGLALSLGAPFWFDLLSKLINLRGAGAKPKREDEMAKGGVNRM